MIFSRIKSGTLPFGVIPLLENCVFVVRKGEGGVYSIYAFFKLESFVFLTNSSAKAGNYLYFSFHLPPPTFENQYKVSALIPDGNSSISVILPFDFYAKKKKIKLPE